MNRCCLSYGVDREKIVALKPPAKTVKSPFSLEDQSKPVSVIEVLRDVFGEDFHTALSSFVKEYPDEVRSALHCDDTSEIYLQRTEVHKVESSTHQSIHHMIVDLIVRGTFVEQSDESSDNDMFQELFKWKQEDFRFRYILDMKPCHPQCRGPVITPLCFSPVDFITKQEESITNKYLLPIMYQADYPRVAKRMLKTFYPEALVKATAVDGEELARRMGLMIRKLRFEDNSNIMGCIYFAPTKLTVKSEDGSLEEMTADPGTILINLDMCPTYEILNSTIVHECVHMYLDFPFYMLQIMSGRPFEYYTSRKRDQRFVSKNGAIDWMELQAEKMPAFILMEDNNTKKEIGRLLAECGGRRSPENMSWIMGRLSAKFKVSKSMAKYRMIELGYPEAEGIYGFVDRQRIPDHGCAGTWNRGVTYTISLKEASKLYGLSSSFAEEISSGGYTYIEGHFCLNYEPFVETDRYRNRRMTTYARHHMEECCIAFTASGRYTDAGYEKGQAARKIEVTDKYLPRHDFAAAPGSKMRIKENDDFMQDAQLWMKLKIDLPDNARDAVQMIIDLKGITQETLAARLGVSRKALNKWCSQPRMSVHHAVGICVALNLRADVGEELVRLTGYPWRNNKHDNLLRMMMFCSSDLTVERCNEILRQEGFPPLNEGRDDSLSEY